MEKRLEKAEGEVDRHYKDRLIEEISAQIAMLESKYNAIKHKKTIHPARLHAIEEKIKKHKTKIKK